MQQISLFDLPATAVNLFDGRTFELHTPEPWMCELVPEGEAYIPWAGHACVLFPVGYTAADVKPGHAYYHFISAGQLYSSIFTAQEGGEEDDEE